MSQPEPWLRGTLAEYDTLRRAVLHALQLAAEDVARWTAELTDEELEARPLEMASVGFHLRHIARSLDRLLSYAEGEQLSDRQMQLLRSEMTSHGREQTMLEFAEGLELAAARVTRIDPASYESLRGVGRKALPTAVGALLVHCADHTQRHVGQVVTTAKVVTALRGRA
ncbi:MAG: DinB family protein [Acidobacteriota bacterium]|nr:DinB family protein [Acidobacteriota bacterium]